MTFYNGVLANTISCLRVGYLSKHRFVIIPTTRYTRTVLVKLLEIGFISSMQPHQTDTRRKLYNYHKITLTFKENKPQYTSIRLLYKQSRTYSITLTSLREFSITRRGILILNTSRGLLTNTEACEHGVGGKPLLWILV